MLYGQCAQEILNMLPDYGMSSCNPKYKEELEQSNRNRKIQQEDLLAMDKKLCATSKGYIELISSSNVGWPTDDLNFNRHFPNKFELDKCQTAAMPLIIHLNNQMQQNLICEQAEEVRLQWLRDERARIPTRSCAKDNSNPDWLDLQVQLPHAAEMSKHVLVKIEELKRGADKIIINAGKKKGELDSHQVERELLKKKVQLLSHVYGRRTAQCRSVQHHVSEKSCVALKKSCLTTLLYFSWYVCSIYTMMSSWFFSSSSRYRKGDGEAMKRMVSRSFRLWLAGAG